MNYYPASIMVTVHSESEMRAVYAVLANPTLADPLLLKNHWNSTQSAIAAVEQMGALNTAPVKEESISISTVQVDETGETIEEAPAVPKRRGRPPKAKDTGTSEPSPESSATNIVTSPAVTEPEPDPTDTDEDDEFAAFKTAMEKADAQDDAAVASVPARKWTDADLSALNNQAAQKIGSGRVPEIKAIVARYVPEGEVPHSRNIPEDDRDAFAAEIEKLADIQFAG